MTDEELLIRANRARELLENPVLQEAMAHYELEILNAWKNSPLRDAEGREKLRLMLDAHQKFKTFLENTLEAGKLAKVVQPTLAQRALSIVGRN